MNLGAYITVKFKMRNVIGQYDLKRIHGGDIGACVKEIIEYDGLFESVEDDYEIVSIKKFKDVEVL